PQLLVINKCDLVDPSRALALQREFGGICVSALRCEGIDLLRSALTRWFSGSPEPVGAAPYLTPPLPAR
ncbi:MAG: hypothetical protein GX589_05345, partial [Deltaproteobacteria bacterium]|nr:hypothetical protein [Deltaproteobacteria bacterium]